MAQDVIRLVFALGTDAVRQEVHESVDCRRHDDRVVDKPEKRDRVGHEVNGTHETL